MLIRRKRTVTWLCVYGEIVLEFIDGGVPFNPLAKADPDISLPPEQREIGGLGIFLVREMMDDVAYAYVNKENRLTIKKKYPQSEDEPVWWSS